MRDKACIIKYENGIATVIPLLSDTCINCNSPTCAKRGTFQASNPQNLKLKSGDIVKIEAPATTQIAQGFLSLIVPILSAVAGYFLAEPVAKLWGIPVTESMRTVGVLILLALSTGIIFILSKTWLKLSKPQVTAVIHSVNTVSLESCPL